MIFSWNVGDSIIVKVLQCRTDWDFQVLHRGVVVRGAWNIWGVNQPWFQRVILIYHKLNLVKSKLEE